MEINNAGNNGKIQEQKPQFKYKVSILFNDDIGDYVFETNVPNAIIGYGMLEFGKRGIDNHLAKLQQKNVIPLKGGIMNFARKIFC